MNTEVRVKNTQRHFRFDEKGGTFIIIGRRRKRLIDLPHDILTRDVKSDRNGFFVFFGRIRFRAPQDTLAKKGMMVSMRSPLQALRSSKTEADVLCVGNKWELWKCKS
jgi:hypothetical protein